MELAQYHFNILPARESHREPRFKGQGHRLCCLMWKSERSHCQDLVAKRDGESWPFLLSVFQCGPMWFHLKTHTEGLQSQIDTNLKYTVRLWEKNSETPFPSSMKWDHNHTSITWQNKRTSPSTRTGHVQYLAMWKV